MILITTFHISIIWKYCLLTDDFNEETDDPDSEGKCSIVISLMQEHRQSRRNVKVKRLQIGFMLYQVFVMCYWIKPNKILGVYINRWHLVPCYVAVSLQLKNIFYICQEDTCSLNGSLSFGSVMVGQGHQCLNRYLHFSS
jgi:hypothetical protein